MAAVRTVSVPPSGMASIALSIRLRTTRVICSGSAGTVRTCGIQLRRPRCTRACASWPAKSFKVSATSALRLDRLHLRRRHAARNR